MDKYCLFLCIAEVLNKSFNFNPLLFGSLGLEQRLNTDLHADDIDILVPEHYLQGGWTELCGVMKDLGYELYDLHEHAFRKNGCSAAFASIESLVPFADVDITAIPCIQDGSAAYLLLELQDYKKVYQASTKDGYRIHKKEKKDYEKLALIEQALIGSDVPVEEL